MNEFYLCYFISFLILGLSLVWDIFIDNIIYLIHKRKTGICVDYRKKVIVFSCISKIICFIVTWTIERLSSGNYIFGLGILETIVAPISYKIIGIVVAMIFIFICDYFVALRRVSYEWLKVTDLQKLILSILFTMLNAPFLFLLEHWNFW